MSERSVRRDAARVEIGQRWPRLTLLLSRDSVKRNAAQAKIGRTYPVRTLLGPVLVPVLLAFGVAWLLVEHGGAVAGALAAVSVPVLVVAALVFLVVGAVVLFLRWF